MFLSRGGKLTLIQSVWSSISIYYLTLFKAPVSVTYVPTAEVDRHFIKEKIDEGTICMTYVPTAEKTADVLTKGLSKPLFEKLVDKLGMYNL